MGEPLILVCDDARNIAQSIVLLLQAEGYRARATSSALECVGVARKDRPALILMDVMMPGLDGATASALMRDLDELQAIPILLISAMSEEEVRARAEECGANGFLTKPFSKQALLQAVRIHVPPLPARPQAG